MLVMPLERGYADDILLNLQKTDIMAEFRKARPEEAQTCYDVLSKAREKMWREGSDQWTEDYPSLADVQGDIAAGNAYILEHEGSIVAYGAVIFTGEPAYDGITDGKWVSDMPYVVVHRFAVHPKAQGHGFAKEFLGDVESLALSNGVGSFRIDTRRDNHAMLHIVDALKFTRCGTVVIPVDKIRIGFEKLLG